MLVRIPNLDAQGVRPVTQGKSFCLQTRATSLFTLHRSPIKTLTDEEHSSVNEAQGTAFGSLQDDIVAAEQDGQGVYIKEHALTLVGPFFWSQYTFGPNAAAGIVWRVESAARSARNITIMPDEFLKIWKPTFLIRHPAVMLPSCAANAVAHVDESASCECGFNQFVLANQISDEKKGRKWEGTICYRPVQQTRRAFVEGKLTNDLPV